MVQYLFSQLGDGLDIRQYLLMLVHYHHCQQVLILAHSSAMCSIKAQSSPMLCAIGE